MSEGLRRAEVARRQTWLGVIGGGVRARARFLLLTTALLWGLLREALLPSAWRRTVRFEFRRILRQAIGGGLATVAATATLIGLGIAAEALAWLRLAGQEQLVGTLLAILLVRQLGPVLVGLILLGRSGTVVMVELGQMAAGGQMRVLAAQGLDPFQLLVLPRAAAFAVASFALGVLFVAWVVLVVYAGGWTLGVVNVTLPGFVDRLLNALQTADFFIFPIKMALVGTVVAVTACLTGLEARAGQPPEALLPRGFVRGVVGVLASSLLLTASVS